MAAAAGATATAATTAVKTAIIIVITAVTTPPLLQCMSFYIHKSLKTYTEFPFRNLYVYAIHLLPFFPDFSACISIWIAMNGKSLSNHKIWSDDDDDNAVRYNHFLPVSFSLFFHSSSFRLLSIIYLRSASFFVFGSFRYKYM